jgi:starvation-inducible DNA-binding protein
LAQIEMMGVGRNHRPAPPLRTPTDLSTEAVQQVSAALNGLLADTFAVYVKTKNFHWHVSGPFFRSYHLLLDEQAETLEGSIDILAERVRKIGGTTIRSIGQIASLQRIKDNEQDFVPAQDMLRELMSDNKAMIESMRSAHEVADAKGPPPRGPSPAVRPAVAAVIRLLS